MAYSPKQIGLLQATALSAYITAFAVSAFRVQGWARMSGVSVHPIEGIMLFLLAFVISAMVSGSIVFAYPIMIFFDGKRLDALHIILWTAFWLIAIFVFLAVVSLSQGY